MTAFEACRDHRDVAAWLAAPWVRPAPRHPPGRDRLDRSVGRTTSPASRTCSMSRPRSRPSARSPATSAAPDPPPRHRPRRHELPHLRAQPIGRAGAGEGGPHHRQRPAPRAADARPRRGVERPERPIRLLGDNTITESEWLFDFSFPESEGDPNPHLWMNVQYALHYAELMRDWFAEADPANADYYARTSRPSSAASTTSTRKIGAGVPTVPEANRKLLTYHDSWAYWAREYGFDGHRRRPGVRLLRSQPAGRRHLIDQVRASRCRPSSAPRSSRARCSSRSRESRAPRSSTRCATTSRPAPRLRPSTPTWAC